VSQEGECLNGQGSGGAELTAEPLMKRIKTCNLSVAEIYIPSYLKAR